MGELPPLILYARCLSFLCYLIVSPCTLFLVLYCPDTHGASMGSPLAFLVGQLSLDQIFFSPLPLQKSTISQHQ